MKNPSSSMVTLVKRCKLFTGHTAQFAELGFGSAIIIGFGEYIPDLERHEWSLFISRAAWLLESETELLTASQDPQTKLSTHIAQLVGKQLEAITFSSPSLEAQFAFTGNFHLQTYPIYSEERTHWVFFSPDEHELVIGPGNTWSYK